MKSLHFKAALLASAFVLPALLSVAHAEEEIVVTGRLAKTAAKLEMESKNNVTVLTAADIARTPDNNVAESLSRLPGISVLNSIGTFTNGVGIDGAARGEGNFVTLRGMDAQYDTNTINGVDVAQGRAFSRGVSLSLLPPAGLQQIIFNKSLTADMNGDAIGGSIDFRTPNAFDFAKTTYGSVQVTGGLSDMAQKYGQDAGAYGVSGEYAHRFGASNEMGLYVAAYFDKKNFTNGIVDAGYPATSNSMYTFALQTASGASLPGVDPSKNLVSTGVDAGVTNGYTQRVGGNVSFDWRPNADFAAYTRITYAFDQTQQSTYYDQIYGQNVTNQQIGTSGVYVPLIQNIQPRFYYTTNPETQLMTTYQTGANLQFGKLHLSPNVFASYGEDNQPDHFELSARDPENGNGPAFGGSSLFTYNDLNPIAILSPSLQQALSNIPAYGSRRYGELSTEFSHQFKYGLKLDATYDFDDGILKSISAGVKYSNSIREHTYRDYTSDKVQPDGSVPESEVPTFGSLGFLSGGVSQIVPGVYNFQTPFINQGAVLASFHQAIASEFGNLNNASDQCGPTLLDADNCDTQKGSEAVTSVYVSALLKADKLQVIPGFRYEHTDIANTYWENDNGNPGYFASDHSSFDKPLPSVQVNYQADPETLYRVALYSSYVKPTLFQLGGGTQTSTDVDSRTISITEGNPNLKAIDAWNFDASGEWLNAHGGSATVDFFYKELKDFIYDQVNSYTNAVQLTNASPNGYTTYINTPVNGGNATVYGLELAGRQKLVDMPDPINGFGIGGNLTYEQSKVNTGDTSLSTHERLLNQPNYSGNLQLFYEKYGYHADLSYRYVSDFVTGYGTLGATSALDTWVRANTKLDLHLGYDAPYHVKLDLYASNLLNSESYYATIGKTSNQLPSLIYSGRTYTFKVSYSF